MKSQGIVFITNAAHTPEHNSLAERAIKTIVGSARCMLIASGLPTKFWAESCRNAVLVQNASPTKPNSFISAAEKWGGAKSDVSRLRTFGCRVLVKDPDIKGKFTIRTWNGINMGPAQVQNLRLSYQVHECHKRYSFPGGSSKTKDSQISPSGKD